MSPADVVRYAEYYRFSKGDIHNELVRALDAGNTDILKYLVSYEQGKAEFSRWILSPINSGRSREKFEDWFPLVSNKKEFKSVIDEWIKLNLIDNFHEELFQKSIVYIAEESTLPKSTLIRKYWVKGNDPETESKIIFVLGNPSSDFTLEGREFFDWLSAIFDSGELDHDSFSIALLNFVSYPTLSQRAKSLLLAVNNKITNKFLEVIAQSLCEKEHKFAQKYFLKLHEISLEKADIFFTQCLHTDLLVAEALVKNVLSGSDSVFRKSVIVRLINHGSSLAIPYVDEAFSGRPERRVLFLSIDKFIRISEAAKEYIKLAKHDYLETGKTSWVSVLIRHKIGKHGYHQSIFAA